MSSENPLVLAPIITHVFCGLLTLTLWRFNRLQRFVGVLSGIFALGSTGALAIQVAANGVQVYRLGGWQPPYGIALAADGLTVFFTLMVGIVVMAAMLYTYSCREKSMLRNAYMPLALMQAAALNGAFITGDIFTFFVFMELLVITSVILVANSDNPDGVEAATKYLLISASGTLLLLAGIAMVYANYGTLNMADIARLAAEAGDTNLAAGAAMMLMCAFLLKSAAFPFHFWQPDFHTTAPTPVHAVLSSVVVKIGVYGLIRMTTLLFTAEGELEAIRTVLLVLGTISIFFGSLGAFRTYDGKRMLAYSTFGQIGFILLGIGWGTPLALAAAIVYAFNHAFIKSALLMLFGVVSSRTQTKSARLTEVAGVGRSLPLFVGLLYLLGGMALAGIPPLNGFISKLALVQSGIDAQMWLTLGLAIGAGILTLMYMTRTWQLVFQQKPDASTAPLKTYNDSPLAPALLIAGCVALGLFAAPLAELATAAADQILNAPVYIEAVLGVEPAAIVGR